MKNVHENTQGASWMRRVIAALLVFSMVVIPVQFPDSAAAAEQELSETYPPNYLVDDFTSTQHLDGVKYQYVTSTYENHLTEEGVYSTYVTGGTKNMLELKTVGANDSNPSASWTNYTVEADVQRDGGLTTADRVYLIGRKSAAGYYAMMWCGNNFTLWKVDQDGFETRLADKGTAIGNRDFQGWAHIKMTFRGNKISIILTGNKADGTPVETVHEFTDNTYTKGGVGLWTVRATSTGENWTGRYKNFKVTLENGTVAYSGPFDLKNSRTINGVECSWVEKLGDVKNNFSDTGGQLVVNSGPPDGQKDENGRGGWYDSYVLLSAESYNPVTKKNVDLSQSWENYSVEADVTRLLTPDNEMAGIVGRLTCGPNASNIKSYYLFASKKDRMILYKVYINAEGKRVSSLLKQGGGDGPRGEVNRLKMEFVDNVIRCYVNDKLVYEYVDDGFYGEPLTNGTAGMYMQSRGWASSFDNFQVTQQGDTTSFFDDFSDRRFFDGVLYQMVSTEDPTKKDVTYNWTTNHPLKFEDGAFKISTTRNMKQWSFLNGVSENGVDVDAAWENYTVEADIRRDGEGLTTGDRIYLMGKVNGEGFYALEYNGELSFRTYGTDYNEKKPAFERPLNQGGVAGQAYTGWLHVRMTFQYEDITISVSAEIGGEERTVTYVVPNNKFTRKFTCGGIGFGVERGTGNDWDAYIKNVKVTLDNGDVVYTDPFTPVKYDDATPATYSWNKKPDGDAKIVMEDNVVKFKTAVQDKRYSHAFLQGVNEDGENVFDIWNDYTVEVDMKREAASEEVRLFLLGRVNPDGSYYAVAYNGNNLDLWRYWYDEEGKLASARLVAGSTGAAGGRDYDGWIHVWLTFEGNTISFGCSHNATSSCSKYESPKYVYIQEASSVPYLTKGGVGLRADSYYTDLGPDKTANTGDEDGPMIGWFDNLKVTLPNGTVAYEDKFDTVPADKREDVTYKWNVQAGAGNTAGADNGVYKSVMKPGVPNLAILEGKAGTKVAGESWGNYFVEMDLKRIEAASSNDVIYVMARMGNQGGYALRFAGDKAALGTMTAAGVFTSLVEKDTNLGDATYGDQVHVEISLLGKAIVAKVSGYDAAGVLKETSLSVTNDKFAYGTIGLLTTGTAEWTAWVDNMKVTLVDGTVVYDDPVNSPMAQFTTYKWDETLGTTSTYGATSSVVNGVYQFNSENGRITNTAILTGGESWKNYTFGSFVMKETTYGPKYAGLIGRANPVYGANGELLGYTYYYAGTNANNGGGVKIYKRIYNPTKNKFETIELGSFYNTAGAKLNTGVWRYMEQEFVGAKITLRVYAVDGNGNKGALGGEFTATDPGTKTDTSGNVSAVYTSGSVGLVDIGTDANNSAVISFKDPIVTQADGTVAFAEDFSDTTDYFTGAEYRPAAPEGGYDNAFDADGLTVTKGYYSKEDAALYDTAFDADGMTLESAYLPPLNTKAPNNAFYPEGRVIEDAYTVPLINNWTVADGNIYKTGTDAYPWVIQQTYGEKDFAREWDNYSAEVDFMLTGSESRASLVFNYTDAGYYYVLFDGSKMYLYHSESEAALLTKNAAMALNIWQFVKVEVEGKVVDIYVNGSLLATYTLQTATGGTAGLRAVSNVRFDNLAIYPNQSAGLRKFTSYKFNGDSAQALTSVWNFDNVANWSVGDRTMTYTVSGVGKAQLRVKNPITNYFAEVSAMPTSDKAVLGVQGRASGSSGYVLTVDMAKGITLTRNGKQIASISKEALYIKGIKLLPNQEYTLRLEMYGGSIRGFLNGDRVVVAKDSSPLPTGVAGLTASKDVKLYALTIGETYKDTVLKIVDQNGKEVKNLQVNVGKVPDIKNLYLTADKGDGNPVKVELDMILDDSKFDKNAKGTVTFPVEFDGSVINFTYKVVERSDYIKKLNKDIEALSVETVTEEQYKDVYNRFNDLSAVEKTGITETNQAKLKELRHAVLLKLHPMLADYQAVYDQSFDTEAAMDDFILGRWENGTRNTGDWYVENGKLYQYFEDESVRDMSSECQAKLNRHIKPAMISVDVQVQGTLTWFGITLNRDDMDNHRVYFMVSDKTTGYGGNRIRFYGHGSTTSYVEDKVEKWFKEGDWINLKMIFNGDYVRCYVNGELYLEAQQKPSMGYDYITTQGAIGLYSAEGYHAFDNLLVYGEEVPYEKFDKINEDLPATSWSDDFQDEKNNVGKDPSHWIENNINEKWVVKSSGSNVFYGSKGNTETASNTWLHTLETNVDYSAQLRISKAGQYPVLGLTARMIMMDSYIQAGYDLYLKKWFVKYQAFANVDPVTIYADKQDTAVDFSNWVTVRLKVIGSTLELYKGNALMLTADVTDKPGPGRVGVFAERCDVDIDNVKLELLSGQSHVQDGVLQYNLLYSNGITASMTPVTQLHDGALMFSASGRYISTDNGKTFELNVDPKYNGIIADNGTVLHNGNYVYITLNSYTTENNKNYNIPQAHVGVLQPDGSYLFVLGSELPNDEQIVMSQPGRHPTEYKMPDGTYRIFWTAPDNHGEGPTNNATVGTWSRVWYSDDGGMTWHASKNNVEDVMNPTVFCETFVVMVSKDTTDMAGNPVKKGTMLHYTNYNKRTQLSYTMSTDGGVTWQGDYAMPNMPTPQGSFAVKEDPWNPGTYYMCMFYNYPDKQGSGTTRLRVSLFRSYDGLNWNFLCDVDRWDAESGDGQRALFHATNCYIEIGKDYVYPNFGRNEIWQSGNNQLRATLHRFEKSKLVDREIPKEYNIPEKAILYIEAIPTRVNFAKGSTFTVEGNKVLVHYYDGTTELIDMEDTYYQVPDMTEEGVVSVKVDHKRFRATYDITINASHIGGTATCTDRAICERCGEPYGRTLDHTVEFVKGYEATETTNGMADHYACTACHGTFSDAEGKRKFDAVIPAWVQVEDGEATVDDIMVDKIIDNAADEIVLNLNYEDKFVQDVVFTGEAFKEAAKEGKPFKIVTSELTITFDATAVQAIADAVNKRNDVTISVKFVDAGELNESQAAAVANVNVSKILSAQVLSKGKVISDFGGGAVTIRIPGAKDLQLWYLGDDGTVENMYVTFDGEDMVVELYHFSLYATVSVESNVGLIILIVALAVLVALVAVVFLVPPVRKKVFGLFQKKKEELPEPEAAEAETTNE